MLAQEIMVTDIPLLDLSSSVEEARNFAIEELLIDVPLGKENEFKGLISLDALIGLDGNTRINDLNNDVFYVFVDPETYFLDILKVFSKYEPSIIPVLKDGEYKGLIRSESLLSQFAQKFNFTEYGALISITTEIIDYELSQLTRLIESEDLKILSLYSTIDSSQKYITTTIKLDKVQIRNLIATLNRFNYDVEVYQSETDYGKDLDDRMKYLMKYLKP